MSTLAEKLNSFMHKNETCIFQIESIAKVLSEKYIEKDTQTYKLLELIIEKIISIKLQNAQITRLLEYEFELMN